MTASLLDIVQQAANELGLTAPATVVGSSDPQTIQLLALTTRDCRNLTKNYDWTALQTQFIINLTAPTTTTGDVSNNSDIITNIPTTVGLNTTFALSSIGSPQAQRIKAILSSTSVQTDMLATASASTTPLIFAKDTYAIPDDFDRYIGQTWWDRTNHWRLIGPDSPQMYQYIRSGIFATGQRIRWRQLGRGQNVWRMWPPPFGSAAGGQGVPDALVWEYISNGFAVHVDGTVSNTFTADTDTLVFDSDMVMMGVKWRMWQIKGFDYAALQQEYIDNVNSNFATDGGIPDVYLNRRAGPFLISSANVQDGFWPGPGNP